MKRLAVSFNYSLPKPQNPKRATPIRKVPVVETAGRAPAEIVSKLKVLLTLTLNLTLTLTLI